MAGYVVTDTDEKAARHRTLLTNIANFIDEGSHEFKNFLEHMKAYKNIPRSVLCQPNVSILDCFAALENSGYLSAGKYEILMEILRNSGNNKLLNMIEEAEGTNDKPRNQKSTHLLDQGIQVQIEILHRTLLTTIADFVVYGSHEYRNFLEHMKVYEVSRTILNQGERDIRKCFDALESKNQLSAGNYGTLRKVATNSGNLKFLEFIDDTEKKISALKM